MVGSPAGFAGLSPEMASQWVDSLPVLGSHLKTPGDREDAHSYLGDASQGLCNATSSLARLWSQFQRLIKAGLSKQAAGRPSDMSSAATPFADA